MSDTRPVKRPPGLRGFLLVMAGALAIGATAGAVGGWIDSTEAGRGLTGYSIRAAVIGVSLAIGFVLCFRWWAKLDEAAREAHKWAWFWGGSAGMSGGLLLLFTLTLREGSALPSLFGTSPASAFIAGMTTLVLFQFAGYVLAWAWWWLKHR